MNSTVTNERAFPCVHGEDLVQPGMTLRDYLAASALVGILAGAARSAFNDAGMAEWSYRIADAMLAERAKGGDS